MEQLEGRICVEAALTARQRKIKLVLIRQGMHEKNIRTILDEATAQQIPIKYADARELDALAHGKTHGGVVALCSRKPQMKIEDLYEKIPRFSPQPFLLLLEGVDDAQNLGFTLRSAEALGVHAVLIKKHLWDFDASAISRASSGAYERLPLVLFDQPERVLPRLKQMGLRLWGSLANASRTMYDVDLTQPSIIAIGGEKRGLSAAVRKQCDRFIKIPMLSDIDSLSLSHSASIIMAEVMRQRLFGRMSD